MRTIIRIQQECFFVICSRPSLIQCVARTGSRVNRVILQSIPDAHRLHTWGMPSRITSSQKNMVGDSGETGHLTAL
ncbi:unnamed protein product [Mycena citricolor]|uniref:Uncharacterized protein n=1 Tax=Mycena citricolor TaxID=2018698 RepID=A0AAD2K7R2_9AGAR|nr:unnamed protein product [Mycena citricolor]CAK5283842.1 unnamed protein product [Mycena citricolor]CAK5283854.1 unnamed protein product [Mycena citricolor]